MQKDQVIVWESVNLSGLKLTKNIAMTQNQVASYTSLLLLNLNIII